MSLKPVLILLRKDGVPGLTQSPCWDVLQKLQIRGIPYEIHDFAETVDDTKYSRCFIYHYYGDSAMNPWINGTKSIPTVVIGMVSDALKNAAGVITGAVASIQQASDNSYKVATDRSGGKHYWRAASSYAFLYLLDTTDTNTRAIITDDSTGRAMLWARKGVGNWVYFVSTPECLLKQTFEILLASGDDEPEDHYRYPFIVTVDEPHEGGSHQGLTSNIPVLADFFRKRGAVLLCGLDNTTYSPEVKPQLLANADVCKCFVHDHTAEGFASDDVYTDRAAKVSVYDARLAQLQAEGYNVKRHGVEGFTGLPKNRLTFEGAKALLDLGITLVRGCDPSVSGWNKLFGNNPQIFSYSDAPGDPSPSFRIMPFAWVANVTASSVADFQAYWSSTGNNTKYRYEIQQHQLMQSMLGGRAADAYYSIPCQVLQAHGWNMVPLLDMLQTLDSIFELSRGCFKDKPLARGWTGLASERDIRRLGQNG